jgi:hypothetical protein
VITQEIFLSFLSSIFLAMHGEIKIICEFFDLCFILFAIEDVGHV